MDINDVIIVADSSADISYVFCEFNKTLVADIMKIESHHFAVGKNPCH